jgi:hypothetical protein
LRFLIDRQHEAVGRRVEIQPDPVAQLGGKSRILRQLEAPHPVRQQAVRRPDARCTERSDTPVAAAIARPVQCVASPGGSPSVSSTTRSTSAGGNGGKPDFLVFSRKRPVTPSRMNRSCQRHTHGFETLARRMIAAVPHPSAVARMIRARQTCFCGLLRSATTAANRSRAAALTSMLIPSRIRHHRTPSANMESYVCVRPLVLILHLLKGVRSAARIGKKNRRDCRYFNSCQYFVPLKAFRSSPTGSQNRHCGVSDIRSSSPDIGHSADQADRSVWLPRECLLVTGVVMPSFSFCHLKKGRGDEFDRL